MQHYKLVFIMISCFILPINTTLALPTPFSANYEGTKYLFGKAKATISLSRQGEYYIYTMRSKIRFLWYKNKVFDCSVIQLVNNTLRPIEHVHYETYDDKYNIQTLFNWEEGVAIADFQGRAKKTKFSIEAKVWDTMSVQVQLMNDVMNQRVTSGDQYQVAQLGSLLDWKITDVRDVTADISGYSLNTVMISADFKDETITLWLSRKHHFFPVQILVNDVLVKVVSNPDSAQIEALEDDEHIGEVPSCKV